MGGGMEASQGEVSQKGAEALSLLLGGRSPTLIPLPIPHTNPITIPILTPIPIPIPIHIHIHFHIHIPIPIPITIPIHMPTPCAVPDARIRDCAPLEALAGCRHGALLQR